jgi:hypothetical protein
MRVTAQSGSCANGRQAVDEQDPASPACLRRSLLERPHRVCWLTRRDLPVWLHVCPDESNPVWVKLHPDSRGMGNAIPSPRQQ